MSFFGPVSNGTRDATTEITKHLPGGDPERYALGLMESYSQLIKDDQPLPIQTEYWGGLYPSAKLMTVSATKYDHSDSEEKARLLFQSCMGVQSFNPSFCITSYYDLLNLKDHGDSKCIIVMMHLPGSLLNIIGRWDDDHNFELFKPTDINAPSDPAWRGVTSANISLVHNMPPMFFDNESYFTFIRTLGFSIEFHDEIITEELINEGSNTTIERLSYMARVVSGDISNV